MIEIHCGPTNGTPARLVVLRQGETEFRDKIDTDSAFQRQACLERAAAQFELDVSEMLSLDSELVAKADAEDAQNGKNVNSVYTTPAKHGKNVGSVDVDRLWKEFPTSAIPSGVGAYIKAAADSIGCDDAFVAVPLLATIAGAIGTSTRIELKPSWCEPSVVWGGIIGDSGEHKTPAIKAATRFADEEDAGELDKYRECRAAWEVEKQHFDADYKKWQRKPVGEPPEKPEPPVCKRYLVCDVTVEALAERAEDNPRGFTVARDELAGWLGSFDQYKGGSGSDAAVWLSVHNAGPIRVDRRTGDRKTIYVPSAAISLTGSIQPPVLSRALGTSHYQDGLAARVLWAMPPKRPRQWSDKSIPHAVTEETRRIYRRLLSLEGFKDEKGVEHPNDLPLTPEARSVWIEFYNRHGGEFTSLTGELAAAWSKLEGYAARLALVCHLIDWATGIDTVPGAVDEISISRGVALAEWFKNETRRVYAVLGEGDEERVGRELVDFVRRKGGTVTAREVQQSSRAYRTALEAEEALSQLVKAELGVWNTIKPTEKGGRPGRVFQLSTPSTSTEPHETRETRQLCRQADGIEDLNAMLDEAAECEVATW